MLIRLHRHAGGYASLLFVYGLRHLFSWRGSYNTQAHYKKAFNSNVHHLEDLSCSMTKPTKWRVILVWASAKYDQSFCCPHEEATQWAHSEDSDQTGRTSRLICLCWAHMSFSWFCCDICLFWLSVAFNNFSFIWHQCLVATGNLMLTF